MSFRRGLLAAFPPPSSVTLPAAGIDISDSAVRCVVFKEAFLGREVKTFFETPLAPGAVVGGDIENKVAVTDILRSFRLRHNVRYGNVALPERKAYLYQTIVPAGVTDLRSGIEFDFEAHVPLPPNEVIFDFEPVRTTASGTIVAVTAYAKRMVNEYLSVCTDAGITLRTLEVESQALARAVLSPEDRTKTVMLVDLGKKTTRIAIADMGAVSFTATLDVGGSSFTGALVKRFAIDEAEAEKMKSEHGFIMAADNAEIVETLMITASVLKDEVAQHVSYWNGPSADDIPRRPVEKIILVGGSANLIGFPEYLGGFLGVPVVVGNVWANAFSLNEYVPPVSFAESLEYATASGLALRGSEKAPW